MLTISEGRLSDSLSTARDAFMQGMQITAVVGAVMILGMGIAATIVTRRARTRVAAGCT